jgi:hypothetical protein
MDNNKLPLPSNEGVISFILYITALSGYLTSSTAVSLILVPLSNQVTTIRLD